MINGLEGVPGSGKSYEATVYHVLAAVQKGRKVITNLPLDLEVFASIDPAFLDLIEIRSFPMPVRGTWDPERKNAFELFEDGHIEKPVKARTFGHVWDYYSEWKNEKWSGPLFIVDECHIPLPRIGTDSQVVEWFKLHRHFNVDVLLMTQRFRGINDEIAALLGVLVKVRKADILGRADHYIRKVHGGYRGSVISIEERKYRPELFKLYKSHTQGSSVAESSAQDVNPFIVRFRRMTRVILVVGVFILVGSFFLPKPATSAATRPPAPSNQPAWLDAAVAEYKANPPVPDASEPQADSAAADPFPEPYQNKGIHLTGRIAMGDRVLYNFTISQNGAAVSSVSDRDLVKAGYRWVPHTDCAGSLFWQDKGRAVTCDAPQVSMGMAGAAGSVAKDAANVFR